VSLIDDTRVPLVAEPAERKPVPAPRWARLELGVQRQLQTQWCWAAVSTSIAHYFGATDWTQCAVVSEELDEDSCCRNGSSKACNRPWKLDRALDRVDAFRRKEQGIPDDLDEVRREIDAGRPVGIRIGWRGGGGHFVVIEGYRNDEYGVAIEDPWHGASDVPLAHLSGRYQGSGAWTHTYYTRAP
jgi:Papain-like cysteine protease AvrRpt2